MRNTWLILCRAELFGEAIICSDTDVEENCLPVADIDFLLLEYPNALRAFLLPVYFGYSNLGTLLFFSSYQIHVSFPRSPIGLVSVSNLSSL